MHQLVSHASICIARIWPAPFQGALLNKHGSSLALPPMMPQCKADSRGQGLNRSPEKVNHNLPHRGIASSNDLSHINGIGDDLQQHDDMGLDGHHHFPIGTAALLWLRQGLVLVCSRRPLCMDSTAVTHVVHCTFRAQILQKQPDKWRARPHSKLALPSAE